MIRNIWEAWSYFCKIRPGFRILPDGRWMSKAKHDGDPGVSYLISSNGKGEIVYLTMKSYWWSYCHTKLNDDARLPIKDKPAPGDTIKTLMLERMERDMTDGHWVTNVIVMPDETVFTFNCAIISKYVHDYNAYGYHFYGGENGMVFYPLRLAIEFQNDKSENLHKWLEPGKK